jgi:hypothetical protein
MKASVLVLAWSVSMSVGCAAKKDAIPLAAAPTKTVAVTAPEADDGIHTGGLHISEAIVKACGL